MAIIKKSEFKRMEEKQLKNKLGELRKELIRFNAQISTGTPPENPGQVREIKKTIARIFTKLNQIKSKSSKKGEEVMKKV